MSLLNAQEKKGSNASRTKPSHPSPRSRVHLRGRIGNTWSMGFMTETLTACQLLQGRSTRNPEIHSASQAAGFLCLAISKCATIDPQPESPSACGSDFSQNICMDGKGLGSRDSRFRGML